MISMVLGTFAMTAAFPGYLALSRWMEGLSEICGALMLAGSILFLLPGIAHHVFCGVVEWFYIREVSKLIDRDRSYATWQEDLRRVFQYILDNRTLVLRTYHSASRDLLEEAFQHILHQLLLDVVEDCAAGRSVRQEDKEFLVRFYTYSLTGLILDWIGENLKESPEAIIRRLDTLLSGTIPNTLARFEETARQDPQMAG